MAPICVMPPLWTQVNVPPYLSTVGVALAVGEVVGDAVGVVVDLPQLITNPAERITIRAINIIFFT
jgi:hypothetical protein